jgi:hypothetical protein
MMKAILLIVGLIALVMGLHWIGQGTGIFIWPSNPVMDNNPTWTYVGVGTGLVGLVLIGWSRR